MPTFGSLFAGIGGLDLGLEWAGWECRWQVERDPWCQSVLARHWPDVPRYGAIEDVDFRRLEPVELLVGGFPCQPFSLAGRQRGVDDERWLWPEFARAVRVVRPKFVLLENVPNILAIGDGAALSEILGDLAAIGYDAEWQCLSAEAIGAPHRRERFFLVAHTDDPGPQGPRRLDPFGQSTHQRFVGAGSRSVAGTWLPEPDMGRVANGVPDRVDRLRGLGNAVVPQVAEVWGRYLLELL